MPVNYVYQCRFFGEADQLQSRIPPTENRKQKTCRTNGINRLESLNKNKLNRNSWLLLFSLLLTFILTNHKTDSSLQNSNIWTVVNWQWSHNVVLRYNLLGKRSVFSNRITLIRFELSFYFGYGHRQQRNWRREIRSGFHCRVACNTQRGQWFFLFFVFQ